MLGKIHEQQGDTANAIEHYEKFLDLWKDADPGIAEMEDARERLDQHIHDEWNLDKTHKLDIYG
jgi:cytochrome c-type biogenesis protein CcmH/NrfG